MHMKHNEMNILDACLISNTSYKDNRGVFEPSWEASVLEKQGIHFQPDKAYHSYNSKVNTLRGMHYQLEPYGQTKLVSCISGEVLDVIIDLRKTSPSYLKVDSVKLSEGSGLSLYIPAGCAHGFITMVDNATLFYLIEGEYRPDLVRTIRWNDPAFAINWPADDPILSERDRSAANFLSWSV